MGAGDQGTPWPLYSQQRHPVSIVHEAGWAQGLFWKDVENFV